MSKHKRNPQSDIYREKLTRERKLNKTFNGLEIILVVSCFNALFYHFGLDVNPALAIFIILFAMVFVVYIVYKFMNRRWKKKRR